MDNKELRCLQGVIYAVVLVTVLINSCVFAAGAHIKFDIPAGDAATTLVEFNAQSKRGILYLSSVVKGIQTHAVAGDWEPLAALQKMLEGTGLSCSEINDSSGISYSVVVTPPESLTDATIGSATAQAPEEAANNVVKGSREMVVTGSHIHGLEAITAPLTVLPQRELKKSGYAAVHEAVRSLPLSSLAGPREDYDPGSTISNYNRGVSVNLRGLGPGATLVLVNGRRQPTSGTQGNFVDVSAVPWSVVERVEVMPDGASALYGSDAIAGVVNVITVQDLEDTETRTRVAHVNGGGEELLAAQLLARQWDTGKALLAYQFSKRAALPFTARAYAADTDKRPLGGDNFGVFFSNPGTILNPFTRQPTFAIPHGQDGTALTPFDLPPGVNLQNFHKGGDLLPERETHSVYFSGSDQIGKHIELFAEGRFNQRDIAQHQHGLPQTLVVPASNPFFVNPFAEVPFVLLAYNFFDDLGPAYATGRTRTVNATLGINADLNYGWRATLSASAGQERMHWQARNMVDPIALGAALADSNPVTAFNPFGDGSHTNPATLEAIRGIHTVWADSRITNARLIADGPLCSLPAGGDVKLAVGIDFRDESLKHGWGVSSLAPTANRYSRTIGALFTELAVPLAPRIDLSVAGRYEQYSDVGSTFNPKFGLRWSPSEQSRLRGSWGSSFRAPNFIDLDEANRSLAALASLPDPRSQSGHSVGLFRVGSNASLREETATTWTAGADLVPATAPGFTLALTYFSTHYQDRIIQPGPPLALDILLHEDLWQAVVTRNPSESVVAAICSSRYFIDPPENCRIAAPTVLIDLRSQNLAVTKLQGLDVKLDQLLDTRFGHFNFGVSGTYFSRFMQAFTLATPFLEIRNTVGNPAALRLRSTADWYQHGEQQSGFGVSAAINHVGKYHDNLSQPNRVIDSLTTLDLQLSYQTAEGAQWTNNVEMTLGSVNVFNKDPPFFNEASGYDAANAEPLGRVITFVIQKNW